MATIQSPASWVEIDQKALEHNIRSYKATITPTLLAPVIKSNAYGHGIELIAKICDQNKHIDIIAVVSLHEALQLRTLGIKKQLLVLSIIDDNIEQAITQDINLVAYDMDMIQEFNSAGQKLNKKAQIHIKVDTGLSRLGFSCPEILERAREISTLPFINIHGIFTHLAESELTDQTFTNQQLDLFNILIEQLENIGINIPLRHAACSAATLVNKGNRSTVARLGIGLYGLWPSEYNKQTAQQLHPDFSLQPVLTWKTKIVQIKEIPAGSYIGYNRSHQVKNPTRLALLPVGYWDGYDRSLSNKGQVLINNQLAPIVGKVAMNLIIVDITGLDVSLEHEVILLGNYPGVTANDLARHCNTISWEIVTRINPLLPRIIKN